MHARLLAAGLGGAALVAVSFSSRTTAEVQSQPVKNRSGSVSETAAPTASLTKFQVMERFLNENPQARFELDVHQGRIERVYGPAFTFGNSVMESADRFRVQHAPMFGVPSQDLVAGGPFEDGRHQQGLMYDAQTDSYKFTAVYYQQVRDGVPVFGSRLTLLVRNEPTFPITLASVHLRELGDFHVTAGQQDGPQINQAKALATVRDLAGKNADIQGPTTFIWAGYENVPAAEPALALQYVADNSLDAGLPWRRMYLVDAVSGVVLYEENLVHSVDIAGTVKGNATSDFAAWNCASPEVLTNIPFARVTNGINTTHTDINGNFNLPNAGNTAINVTASLQNNNFVARNSSAGNVTPSMVLNVTPPGPANFVFNPAVTEHDTALVNSFIHANLVRNYVLQFNPSYPTVATQANFPVNVNIGQNCNAFYSASTINFYIAGGGCANTGYSSVVYHEFGHNLIEKAGSGQGAYGEGQSDVIAVLMQDDPCLGNGFQSCGVCLRSAVNNCTFSASNCSACGSAIHTCGQLISGTVWNLRNKLLAVDPANYRAILSNLAINSMFLHSGTSITNSICIDYLTLDDNDNDITNGTPHYNQINTAFTERGFAGSPLAAVLFAYPNGRPSFVSPAGGTTMRVHANAGAGSPQPGTGILHVSTGGPYTQIPMSQISPNVYDAVFPAVACGTPVKYYVSVQTTGGATVTSPTNAPTTTYSTLSGVGLGAIAFEDNFNNNLGWAVTNVSVTGGQWERGVPRTDCNRSNPLTDGDGSGSCYLTQNSDGPLGDVCNSDIDGGTTTLTSPIMDASGSNLVLSYSRWYDNLHPNNNAQDDPFVVEFSINGGSSWQNLETVGPTGPEADGGWIQKQWVLASVPGFSPTSQFRVRFIARDTGTASVVEAAVDGVKVQAVVCAAACPADVTVDSQVNVADLLAVISAWGPCNGCAADINDDNQVNVADLLAVISAWGACP